MNTNDKQKLSLIFKFVETFQNQICGVIRLNENSNLEAMEQFLIENKCNSIFDYYEVDKDSLIIEME